jgi:hypothetical protein
MVPARRHSTPRSTRRTAPRPELWAMSVALLDHGERVPSRGTTTRTAPSASGVAGAP